MKIYLVGGAVRDELLSYPFTEKDWVVVGSSPKAMQALGYTPVGKDFPVFLHPQTNEEYALARTERKVAPGYKGFTFHTDSSVSLEQDLQRRDLTINAIAKDSDGVLIDPYNGQRDIKNKVLRHVSDAFTEDPVRILRVARFAARYHHLGFTVADETITLMQTMVAKGETQHLVTERVWQEFHKALSEKDPVIFFEVLEQCGALKDIIPGLDTHHLSESLHYLAYASRKTKSPLIRFAAWCYGAANDVATKSGTELGAERKTKKTSELCQQLAAPKRYPELARMISLHYALISQQHLWNPNTLANLFMRIDAIRKPERFNELLLTCEVVNATENNEENTIATDLLTKALHTYANTDIKSLIQKGFKGQKLGEAIALERIENLKAYLTKKPKR